MPPLAAGAAAAATSAGGRRGSRLRRCGIDTITYPTYHVIEEGGAERSPGGGDGSNNAGGGESTDDARLLDRYGLSMNFEDYASYQRDEESRKKHVSIKRTDFVCGKP